MPPRLVSLAILVYWCIAAFCLLSWEVLPELTLGYPPDLHAIAAAGESGKPVSWSIQIIDDPKTPDVRRTVGSAVTASKKLPDGWFELTSSVNFDAEAVLKETAMATRASVRLELGSIYRVDPAGNLRSFDMKVSPVDSNEALFAVHGRLHAGIMEIVSKGPVPLLNQKFSFAYEPRSVVHDALGPMDRLPGLHIGQRWDTRVVNPFTGQVEVVRVEVVRRDLIHWNGEPVSAFEVVHRSGPLTVRTWVRSDGVILRQELPLPLVRLVLEPPGRSHPVNTQRGNAPMIELEGVTKLFGNKRAVDQLDLKVQRGRVVCFPGAQWRGQNHDDQDDLRLAGADQGQRASGRPAAASREARQLLGYVPDQPYLYDKLTGREFLRFVVEMYGLDRRAHRPGSTS